MANDFETDDSMHLEHASDPQIEALWGDLLQQASTDTIPSNILIATDTAAAEFDALDGTANSPVVTQMQWLAFHDTLIEGSLGPSAATDIRPAAEAVQANGMIPIYVADFAYERIRPRWFAHLQAAHDSPGDAPAVPMLADMVESHTAFFASVLLPIDWDLFTPIAGRHYGKHATFVVPSDGYRTNTGRSIESVEIDFGSGPSLRVRPGEQVEYEFADYGTQQIALRVHTSDGEARSANFSFEVAEPAPTPDLIWTFEDETSKEAAMAWVYLANPPGHRLTKLTRPVLLSEGFPGGREIDKLWPLVNQSSFVTNLRRLGRDFIILGFKNGTRKIQDNARLYAACVRKINAMTPRGQRIAAGGASMGGLIARYALCWMEERGEDHQVETFFTVDTPHQGANIPMSVQAFVQLYAAKPCGEKAVGPAVQMASPAAQQMLLQWIPPYSQWRPNGSYPLASPERGAFLADLRARGWMPKQPKRRIGVADGLANGKGNGVPGGVKALWFSLSVWHWADLWTSAPGRGSFAAMVNGFEQWTWTGGGGRIDGAPGGTRDSWHELYRSLPRAGTDHPNHCFVPTVSACAIDSSDLYISELHGRPSDLTAFKASSTTNLEHVALPPELASFLIEEITRPGEAPTWRSESTEIQVAGAIACVYEAKREGTACFVHGRNGWVDYVISREPSRWAVDEPYRHEVQSGEALGTLAERYYGNTEAHPHIFAANRDILGNPDLIGVGQRLRIPGWRIVEVRSGDTLTSIGQRYYDDVEAPWHIFAANRDILSSPDLIQPGQRLRLPGHWSQLHGSLVGPEGSKVKGEIAAVYEWQRNHSAVFHHGEDDWLHYHYAGSGGWLGDHGSFRGPEGSQVEGGVAAVYEWQRDHSAVFHRGKDGWLHYHYLGASRSWTGDHAAFRGPEGSQVEGAISAVYEPQRQHSAVFYRGKDGFLHYYYLGANRSWTGDHGSFRGPEGSQVEGAISAVYEPQREHSAVFHRGKDGFLHYYYLGANGQWAADHVSFQGPEGSRVDGAISAVFDQDRVHSTVGYRGVDGQLHLYYKGSDGSWKHATDASTQWQVRGPIAAVQEWQHGHAAMFHVGVDDRLRRLHETP